MTYVKVTRFKLYHSALIFLLIVFYPCFTFGAHKMGGLSLTDLIAEGLANSQELKSLRQRLEGLKEEVPAAAALNDPKLKLGMLNVPVDTFDFAQEPMTQKQISLTQQIPWFEKLSLRRQKAVLQAELLAATISVKEAELTRKVAVAYFDIGFIESSLEINQRLRQLFSDVLRVAESRYGTGAGPQQDILQAQVELSELLDEQNELKRKLRVTKDQINQILHRERFIEIGPVKRPPMIKLGTDAELLVKQAILTTPWMRVRRAEIDLARTDIKLAIQDYMPDFDFSVAYGQRDRDKMGNERADFFSASVGFSIPLWFFTKQDKRLSGAKRRFEAAQLSLNSLKNGLTHQIDALVTDINTQIKNYELLDQALMIQASQWADSSLVAYEVGSIEFNTLISAELRLLRYELKHTRYHYSLRSKIAELEELVGATVAIEKVGHEENDKAAETHTHAETTNMITRVNYPKGDN